MSPLPGKDAGTATLKAGENIWNYLPRVDRAIKVPASLMMGAWMGSHFTNDDWVKESRLIDDYDIDTGYEGDRDGVEVWEFRLSPKPEAAVVWDRIDYQVRKADLMPTWAYYFDEDGARVRTVTFGDYRVTGGRLVPMLTEVIPDDEPGERTVVRYQELEFDIEIGQSAFSLRALRTGR